MRDARRIEEYYPGLSPYSSECMDKLGVSLAHCESKCENFYDAAEVERVFYPEMEKLLLEFFPGATDALVYNHDVFDKDYEGDRTEDQENKNPGVNANYANLVHNDLNDNSGRVRCRELLTKNLRNFGREQTTRLSRLMRRCRVGLCPLILQSRWKQSSNIHLCFALGLLLRISPTLIIIGSTMIELVRPPALLIDLSMSGIGYHNRPLPRFLCLSATIRSSMDRYRVGPFIQLAWIIRHLKMLDVVRI